MVIYYFCINILGVGEWCPWHRYDKLDAANNVQLIGCLPLPILPNWTNQNVGDQLSGPATGEHVERRLVQCQVSSLYVAASSQPIGPQVLDTVSVLHAR